LRNEVFDEKATTGFILKKPLDKTKLLDTINVLLATRVQPTAVVT
jgi:hypothetical protein